MKTQVSVVTPCGQPDSQSFESAAFSHVHRVVRHSVNDGKLEVAQSAPRFEREKCPVSSSGIRLTPGSVLNTARLTTISDRLVPIWANSTSGSRASFASRGSRSSSLTIAHPVSGSTLLSASQRVVWQRHRHGVSGPAGISGPAALGCIRAVDRLSRERRSDIEPV